MSTTASEQSGLHYLTDGGRIVETPAGNPVGCHDQIVVEVAADDHLRRGADPSAAPSVYGLLCTYLDFADTPRSELIGGLLADLEDDIVYREVAMRSPMDDVEPRDLVLGSPWPDAFLRDSEFYDEWEVTGLCIGLGKVRGWFRGLVAKLPPRALVSLVYASACWRAAIPALALIHPSPYNGTEFGGLVSVRSRLAEHLSWFARRPEDREAVIRGVRPSSAA